MSASSEENCHPGRETTVLWSDGTRISWSSFSLLLLFLNFVLLETKLQLNITKILTNANKFFQTYLENNNLFENFHQKSKHRYFLLDCSKVNQNSLKM